MKSMTKIDLLCIGIGVTATLLLSGCSSLVPSVSDRTSTIGAWASGASVKDCQNSPITYFSSDRVVAVLLSAKGPVHSIGSWTRKRDQLTMTHNDFPLDPSGQLNAPVILDIIELSANRFVTRNSKGDVRERIRCRHVNLKSEHEDDSH